MQVRWMAVLSVGGILLIGPAGDLAWAQASPPFDYFSVSPCRLLDTRVPAQGPALASGTPRLVTATGGSCAIPPTARAIAANITSVASTGAGNLRLYAGDGTVPPTSALNFGAGQTRANNGVFALAGNGNGTLAIFATVAGSGTVHAVLDVTGYFAATPCDPDGTYTLTSGGPIVYSCTFGLVNVNITSFTFSMDGARVIGSPIFAHTMTDAATTCPSGAFDVVKIFPGGCTETYRLMGMFTGADTWSATFTMTFTGSPCFDCTNQSFSVTATR